MAERCITMATWFSKSDSVAAIGRLHYFAGAVRKTDFPLLEKWVSSQPSPRVLTS